MTHVEDVTTDGIKQMIWEETGSLYQLLRESLGISVTKAAEAVGVARSTLRNFEEGNPVQRAGLIECSYKSFLEVQVLKADSNFIPERLAAELAAKQRSYQSTQQKLHSKFAGMEKEISQLPYDEWLEVESYTSWIHGMVSGLIEKATELSDIVSRTK